MGKISFIFKTAILGPENCGKQKFLKLCPYFHEFGFKTAPSIGVDFGMISYHFRGNHYKIQSWNLNDNVRFRNFFSSYLRGTKGTLLFFNSNIRQTFDELNVWISLIRYINVYIPIILVGVDDVQERNSETPLVSESEIQELCGYYQIERYFEFKIESEEYAQSREFVNGESEDNPMFDNMKYKIIDKDGKYDEDFLDESSNESFCPANCHPTVNDIIETLLERILYYEKNAYPTIDFNTMVSAEELAQFLHPINTQIDHQNQPELLKYFYKFISKFNKCPICNRENHPSYMQSFFFSKEPRNVRIRDNILFLIDKLENRADIDHIKVGIPCCSCYENVFSEKPHL